MDKTILAFVEKLEIFKTKIKALHWDANSLSQHELCDDIAERIADFQDQVSEVEQSISGKLPKEMFKPTNQEFGEVGTLKEFVESVIDCTNEFYKKLGGKGDKYIGMRSDCESFLSDMQRKLYLVNFTLKEELKMRLRDKINESRPKNLSNTVDVEKFIGRRPKSIKARINQIYRIVKKYGIDSRKYNDEHWQAIEDYYRAITSLGCEVEMKPCASMNHADSLESDGGYTDYDEYDNMPRSKQYAIKIMFDDGMTISGYIKCMAAGTVSDPFSSYDTCMVLWPKSNKVLEVKNMNKQMRLTEAELKQVIKEAAISLIQEYTQKQANTKGFIKSTYGHRSQPKRKQKPAKGSFGEREKKLLKQMGKEVDESIDIDPKNKGKFTATKKATGKSTEELTHSKNPLTRRRAIFAQNAKKWSKN